MNKIILLLFVSLALFANTIKPFKSFNSSGEVTDLVYKDNKLYSATKVGVLDIFDLKKEKIIKKISVPKIKDFMGDEVEAKIYSVDILDDAILLLSQAKMGYRTLFIHSNNNTKQIIGVEDSLTIAKAKFLDKTTVILGLLSNDIISYNIQTKKKNWNIQASGAKFSDFVLSDDKKRVIIADESGNLKIIDTATGKIVKILKGQNLDNVFQVDYKKGIIATAGQDRRCVVYDEKKGYKSYYKQVHFLIYSVGVSPSGKYIGFASDEQNNVSVFERTTKKELGLFTSNILTISKILFKDEDSFFSSSGNKINFYKINSK